MTTTYIIHILRTASFAFVAALTIVALAVTGLLLAEPQISHSQSDTHEFSIEQTITDETTFLINPTDVTMAGGINGVTGGNATGSTQFVVQSNNATGYYVTIDFTNNTGQYTMLGDQTDSEDIFDYNFGGAEPTYEWTVAANAAFGYTVTSSSTGDTDPSFIHNGSNACNTGVSVTADVCWMTPSTTEFRIVDKSSESLTGATSTIKFKVNVPSGATPVPSAETYTATATLSLYTQ